MRALVVATISNTINTFLIPQLRLLTEEGFEVDVACHVEQALDEDVYNCCREIFEVPFDRNPIALSNFHASERLKNIIKSEDYDIIHTHTPIASAITRYIAHRVHSRAKLIYTAHGFHFFRGASPLNWLVYYPIERWLAHYTDVLITINEEDFFHASRFRSTQVRKIPGVGVRPIQPMSFQAAQETRQKIREEFHIPDDAIVLVSVGELNQNKNHKEVIKVLPNFKAKSLYYVICGEGKLHEYLSQYSNALGVGSMVVLAGYRYDVRDVLHASDIFILPSRREGLPVSLIEAMAAGLPVICSAIRGNRDLVKDRDGGILVAIGDKNLLKSAIEEMVEQPDFRSQAGAINAENALQYGCDEILIAMRKIYGEIINARSAGNRNQ